MLCSAGEEPAKGKFPISREARYPTTLVHSNNQAKLRIWRVTSDNLLVMLVNRLLAEDCAGMDLHIPLRREEARHPLEGTLVSLTVDCVSGAYPALSCGHGQ